VIRQLPTQTRMTDISETTGNLPYEPTPPAFLISSREWVEYKIKIVREDGVVVDTVGLILPMDIMLLCLCGVRRRGYLPEMRTANREHCIMRVLLRGGVSVYLVVKPDNAQYFLDHRDSLLAVMRAHLELLKGRKQGQCWAGTH
jgi:hypothetical protein